MLEQKEAEFLLDVLKRIVDTKSTFLFPTGGQYKNLELTSEDNKYKFLIDINRHGKIQVLKCTYQNRFQKENILLRLDINGAPHTNPDGTKVGGCHLHVYREGYGDKWAFELPSEICHTDNLMQTFIDFLLYCKVDNLNKFEVQEVL